MTWGQNTTFILWPSAAYNMACLNAIKINKNHKENDVNEHTNKQKQNIKIVFV